MYGHSPFGAVPYGALGSPGDGPVDVADSAQITDTLWSEILPFLHDRARVSDSTLLSATLLSSASDNAKIVDATMLAWMMLASDSAEITDTPENIRQLLSAITDALRAADLSSSQLSASTALAEAMAIRAVSEAGWAIGAVDSAEFTGAFDAALMAAANLIDSATASGTTVANIGFTSLVSDSATIGDTPQALLQMLQDVSDDAVVFVSVHDDSGEISGWVVNTETSAAGEYRSFNFNSFTSFNGEYYAASDEGVFRLGGDTDDGAAIEAWIRTGMSNFGTGLLKKSSEMFVAMVGGTLMLKVITSPDAGSAKTERYYRMEPWSGTSGRQRRFKIGQGVQSVYWQFELHNVDGADFTIDTIEWHPMNLTRR